MQEAGAVPARKLADVEAEQSEIQAAMAMGSEELSALASESIRLQEEPSAIAKPQQEAAEASRQLTLARAAVEAAEKKEPLDFQALRNTAADAANAKEQRAEEAHREEAEGHRGGSHRFGGKLIQRGGGRCHGGPGRCGSRGGSGDPSRGSIPQAAGKPAAAEGHGESSSSGGRVGE